MLSLRAVFSARLFKDSSQNEFMIEVAIDQEESICENINIFFFSTAELSSAIFSACIELNCIEFYRTFSVLNLP